MAIQWCLVAAASPATARTWMVVILWLEVWFNIVHGHRLLFISALPPFMILVFKQTASYQGTATLVAAAMVCFHHHSQGSCRKSGEYLAYIDVFPSDRVWRLQWSFDAQVGGERWCSGSRESNQSTSWSTFTAEHSGGWHLSNHGTIRANVHTKCAWKAFSPTSRAHPQFFFFFQILVVRNRPAVRHPKAEELEVDVNVIKADLSQLTVEVSSIVCWVLLNQAKKKKRLNN